MARASLLPHPARRQATLSQLERCERLGGSLALPAWVWDIAKAAENPLRFLSRDVRSDLAKGDSPIFPLGLGKNGTVPALPAGPRAAGDTSAENRARKSAPRTAL